MLVELVVATVAMSFWQQLTGDTRGLVFERDVLQHMPRHEQIASMKEVARQRAEAAGDSASYLVADKEDGRATRHHETDAQKLERVLSDRYINACFAGEHVTSPAFWSGGADVKHTAANCTNPLPNGCPCHVNLWADGKPGLEQHLQTFMGKKRKQRSQAVYEEFSPCSYHTDMLPDGRPDPDAKPKWHFFMNGRTVCQAVYVMNNPIGDSQLRKLGTRWKQDRGAHDSKSGADYRPLSDAVMDYKRISVIGWYQYYADVSGDQMPDENVTILPPSDLQSEWKHFCGERGKHEHVSYSYWVDTWNNSPEIAYIRHARRTLNFQHCGTCVNANADVAAALKTGDPAKIAAAKAKRSGHHNESRGERATYYTRREDGRDPLRDSVSIILDKWDSAKCTVPYFARKPAAWWNKTSKDVLAQHVLGVMIHASPKNKVPP